MERKRRLYIFIFLISLGILGLIPVTMRTVAVVRFIPKYQLLGRTTAFLTHAIICFVREHGEMPTGLEDLVAAGLLRVSPEGEYVEIETGIVLYHLDAISVSWSFRPQDAVLVDGELKDPRESERVYIIHYRYLTFFGWRDAGMNSSVRIYKALLEAVREL